MNGAPLQVISWKWYVAFNTFGATCMMIGLYHGRAFNTFISVVIPLALCLFNHLYINLQRDARIAFRRKIRLRQVNALDQVGLCACAPSIILIPAFAMLAGDRFVQCRAAERVD